MSAQTQEQEVDHGQDVEQTQQTDQAVLVDQTQSVNQTQHDQIQHDQTQHDQVQLVDQGQQDTQAQQTAQVANAHNNTVSSWGIPFDIAIATIARLVQREADQASPMTRSSTMVSFSGSDAPVTPFEDEFAGLDIGINHPSMYERGSPIIQPQQEQEPQDEPHPLHRSVTCWNLPLLGRVIDNPSIPRAEQENCRESLRTGTEWPSKSGAEIESRDDVGDDMDDFVAFMATAESRKLGSAASRKFFVNSD